MPELSLAKTVIYRWRPGQIRAGSPEAAAIVTAVNSDGTADLYIMAPRTHVEDFLTQERVAQMSDSVQSHCWRFTQEDYALDELRAQVDALRGKARQKAA